MIREYEHEVADCIAREYDLTGSELALATRAVMGLADRARTPTRPRSIDAPAISSADAG
jgi:hypothetical protein